MKLSIFLIISILAGQLIKFPVFGNLGPTLLDFCIALLTIWGFYQIKFKFRKPPIFLKFGFIFIFIATLSLIFTPLHLTILEYISSFSYTLRLTLYLTFYWLMYWDTFAEFKNRVGWILLSSGIGLAIFGLLQFLIWPNLSFLENSGWDPHYFRSVSTFLDPNFAGAFFVLTLILIPHQRKYTWPFIIVYLALLTTFSRSSYLMFLVSGLTFSFLKKSKSKALLTILLFLGLLIGFQFYTALVAAPRNIDRQQSASSRLNTWQQGLEIFKRSPILGVGFNSYRYAIREYNLGDIQFLQSRGSSSNDSSLLYVLATTGIVGLISYTLFLVSLLKWGLKQNFILAAGLTGLLVHSFFANSLFYPFILIWILLTCAVPKK